jgi:hypothetical protein
LPKLYRNRQLVFDVAANPCSLVEKPRAMEGDPDIRFLEPEEIAEVKALLAPT